MNRDARWLLLLLIGLAFSRWWTQANLALNAYSADFALDLITFHLAVGLCTAIERFGQTGGRFQSGWHNGAAQLGFILAASSNRASRELRA